MNIQKRLEQSYLLLNKISAKLSSVKLAEKRKDIPAGQVVEITAAIQADFDRVLADLLTVEKYAAIDRRNNAAKSLSRALYDAMNRAEWGNTTLLPEEELSALQAKYKPSFEVNTDQGRPGFRQGGRSGQPIRHRARF